MIRHLEPLTEPPTGQVAEVYRQIDEDFGVVAEPFTLHRPVPELLAAAWITFRETIVVTEFLDREVKETIGVAISRANRCPYCVDSHAAFLHALGEAATERAVSSGRRRRKLLPGRSPDPALLVFAGWAETTRSASAADLPELPYTPEQAPEAIGAAACFHYINRMVTALLGGTPLPVASRLLRTPQLKLAARRFAAPARAFRQRGRSLALLPDAEPPEHLAWAAASPRIRGAFARLHAAVARAAEPLLEPATRERLGERLEAWRGEDPPPGTGWLDEAAAGLAPAQAAAARLALLAALAPWRVGESEVAAFRAHHPGDPALVSALAWGAYHAARRVSSWLRTEAALPLT